MYDKFQDDVLAFNRMYKLEPIPDDTYDALDSLETFAEILGEELDEHRDIVRQFDTLLERVGMDGEEPRLDANARLELRTQVADWLGDIIVYCSTMAARWRLPMGGVLNAIMASNFTKLDANGQPIYDSRGKVMKPATWQPPEPAIRALLRYTDAMGAGAKHDQ